MDTIIIIAILVFGTLQIMLFFKIWGMTNDVRDLKDAYLRNNRKTHIADNNPDQAQSKYAQHIKTGDVFILKEYNADINKYVCYSEDGKLFKGSYSEKELKFIE